MSPRGAKDLWIWSNETFWTNINADNLIITVASWPFTAQQSPGFVDCCKLFEYYNNVSSAMTILE